MFLFSAIILTLIFLASANELLLRSWSVIEPGDTVMCAVQSTVATTEEKISAVSVRQGPFPAAHSCGG